jgi:hypothetical protein
LNRSFKDAVVVWFHQAIFAMIEELDHASVLDGRPEQWMVLQQSITILTRMVFAIHGPYSFRE